MIERSALTPHWFQDRDDHVLDPDELAESKVSSELPEDRYIQPRAQVLRLNGGSGSYSIAC
jgi:hypothetical protein